MTIGEWWDARPEVIAASVLVLAIGLAVIARSWLREGRDRLSVLRPGLGGLLVGDAIVPEYAPPDGLSPAEVGVLVDGCASPRHVAATLIDLAIRGHVQMHEAAGRGWVLERTARGDAPRPFERRLLDVLFRHATTVELADAYVPYYWATVCAELDLDDAVFRRGWFVSDPALLRQRRRLLGLALSAGLVVTAVLGIRLGAGLVGMALVVVGITLTIAAGSMRSRTPLGHELMLRSLGFRLYMRVAETRPQRFAEHQDLFTAYLPFAVAFGLAREWADRFDVAGTAYAGLWYRPSSDPPRHVELAERVSRLAR